MKTLAKWFKSHCLPTTNQDLKRLLIKIIMTQQEAATKIDTLTAKTDKVREEVLEEIATLKGLIGNVSPEVEASLARLEASVQTSDDVIPDKEVPPTT